MTITTIIINIILSKYVNDRYYKYIIIAAAAAIKLLLLLLVLSELKQKKR